MNAGQNQKYIIHTLDVDKTPEIRVRCATESKKEYDLYYFLSTDLSNKHSFL